MFYNNINNLKIDKDLYKKILKAIRFIALYRSDYHFKKLEFKRIYPKPATGSHFYINRKLNLMIKSSWLMEVIDNVPKKYHKYVIPSIVLSFNEYRVSVSEWVIQPIADLKNRRNIAKNMKNEGLDKYFFDLSPCNVGSYKERGVLIDW